MHNHVNETVARPQFRSALANDGGIDDQEIATAVRAIFNAIRVSDQAIARLNACQVTAADVLLGRLEAVIDFSALERAREGVDRLAALLGEHGTVVYECGDHSVASLREQLADAERSIAPYRKLKEKKR